MRWFKRHVIEVILLILLAAMVLGQCKKEVVK